MTVRLAEGVELVDAATGRRLRLVRQLGVGGQAAVWLADVWSPGGLLQRLALKVLPPAVAGDPVLAARLRHEARLLGRLQSDHVVQVHGLVELGPQGVLGMLLEHVDGVDLAALGAASPGGVPPRAAAEVGAAVAEALHAALTWPDPETGRPLNIVHRDVKPSNVLISRTGGVKLVDFGVARGTLPREGVTVGDPGTARYLAPERWLTGRAEPASDVYSLGATLWELTRATPWARPPLEASGHAAELAARLSTLEAGTDDDRRFVAVLGKCLAFDPRDRPVARVMADALRDLAGALPGPPLTRLARERVPPLVDRQVLARAAPQTTASLPATPGPGTDPADRTPSLGSGASPAQDVTPTPTPTATRSPPPPLAPRVPRMAVWASLAVLAAFGALWATTPAPPAPHRGVPGDEAPSPGIPREGVPGPEQSPPPPAPTTVEASAAAPPPTPRPTSQPASAGAPPSPRPEREPAAAAPDRAPPPLTTLQLTALPVAGTLRVAGQEVRVFDTFQVPPGPLSATFTSAAGVVACEVQVTSGVTRLHFEQGEPCRLLP